METANITRYLKDIDKNTTVYGWDQEVCNELRKRDIKYELVDVSFNEKDGINWIKRIAKSKIINNENLLSFFEFKGTSLWWWMEYWLYLSYTYYDSFSEIIKNFCIFYRIIKNEKPDQIIYINQGVLHNRILKLISEAFGIKTKVYKSYFNIIESKLRVKLTVHLIKKYFATRFTLRRILFSYKLNNKNKTYEQNKYILSMYQCVPLKDYTLPVLDILWKHGVKILALDIPGELGFLNFGTFKKKIREYGHILLEDYISKKDIMYVNEKELEFKKTYHNLKRRKEFRDLFIIENISVWKLIEPIFSCYFNIRLRNHLLNFIGIENVIQNLRPKVVLTPAETTEFDKGLFIACQKIAIPVVAMQHGILYDLRCIHEKDEVSLEKLQPQYCPIPNITTVYGQTDKDFLLKYGNYPQENVIVTGNSRYDQIVNERSKYDKQKICKELNIDPNKKIVVLITGPLPIATNRKILTQSVCESAKELSNIQLIVKVHHMEKSKYYSKIVQDCQIPALITKYDIFKILYISDCVITIGSTAGLEAVIFGKPIIRPNYIEEPNPDDYVQEGVAIAVDDSKDLTEALKKVLYDQKTIDKLKKNRKSYVFNHCDKMDGKASHRIADIVESFLR